MEDNGGKYVRQPRFFKNCRATEKKNKRLAQPGAQQIGFLSSSPHPYLKTEVESRFQNAVVL
jgi:hypothetical protein